MALHAVRRAGTVLDRSALVVGAGPIGCLAVAVLRAEGAREVVACDVVEEALRVATATGAHRVVVAGPAHDESLAEYFDVVIEASGSPAGLATAIRAARRGGTVVQLGLLPPGDVLAALNLLVTREISPVGAFRFAGEFSEALDLLAGGIAAGPVVTAVLAFDRPTEAFDLAADPSRSSKVLLDFTGS